MSLIPFYFMQQFEEHWYWVVFKAFVEVGSNSVCYWTFLCLRHTVITVQYCCLWICLDCYFLDSI